MPIGMPSPFDPRFHDTTPSTSSSGTPGIANFKLRRVPIASGVALSMKMPPRERFTEYETRNAVEVRYATSIASGRRSAFRFEAMLLEDARDQVVESVERVVLDLDLAALVVLLNEAHACAERALEPRFEI